MQRSSEISRRLPVIPSSCGFHDNLSSAVSASGSDDIFPNLVAEEAKKLHR